MHDMWPEWPRDSLKDRVDKWAAEVMDSLDNREITNFAYEVRDLDEIAEALIDLADELWDMGHNMPSLTTLAAGRAVAKAAYQIGEIDG